MNYRKREIKSGVPQRLILAKGNVPRSSRSYRYSMSSITRESALQQQNLSDGEIVLSFVNERCAEQSQPVASRFGRQLFLPCGV